jgi:hypothetical protein
MIPTIAFVALQCAAWDYEAIQYRILHNGQNLDHAPMWRFRAFAVTAAACIVWWFGVPVVPLLGLGAFGFSALFRWRLNTLRGLDWRYVRDSNEYDWLFIATFSDYKTGHHRAGLYAYITELTITAACLVWVALSLSA